jgi:tripartite-type tricarboxylate transporter receptor subunit TctC
MSDRLHRRTVIRLLSGAAFAAALSPLGARAQSGKMMKLILPVGAGSGVDAAARVMTDALAKALDQTVIVENAPGAGGVTGTARIVKAPKDGNTLGVVSNNHVVNPSVYKSMPFDSLNDITPIMVVGATPFVLVVHPSVPAKNLEELLALARAKPGVLNYGSSGTGTILHLAAQMLVSEGNVDIVHVPYRSTGQLLNDLIGGQVQLGFVSTSVAAQHIKAGTLRTLGVSTTTRSRYLPDIPTIAEAGLPNYSLQGWFAVIGPGGLPAAEVARIHKALKDTLETARVRDALLDQGYTLLVTSPEEAARYFASEMERMHKLVVQAGIKPE